MDFKVKDISAETTWTFTVDVNLAKNQRFYTTDGITWYQEDEMSDTGSSKVQYIQLLNKLKAEFQNKITG